MNTNKKCFFFDTSILSSISFIDQNHSSKDTKIRWEQFLNQMDIHHSNFADVDFTWITSPALFLELIGLGQIRNELKKTVSNIEWKDFVSSKSELNTALFCDRIAKRIRTFVLTKLPAKKLYRMAVIDFQRKYKSHPFSHFITARIKRWGKDLRNPENYKVLASSIFWDTLFRYPFINLKHILPRERLLATQLWAGVMGRLFRNYYELYKDGFGGSVLGLFTELHRIGACFNSPDIDQNKYDPLMRTWDDMADADSISLALLGKNQQAVHIVTMDKKTDIERRLLCLAKNLNEMTGYGFNIEFYPGTISIFSQTLELTDFLSVQDIISSVILQTSLES